MEQQQARKALRDDACTGLSPVKIWRKNAGLLQSSYTYRQWSISAGVEQTTGKVKDFSAQHRFTICILTACSGKMGTGHGKAAAASSLPASLHHGVPGLGDQLLSADCHAPLWAWLSDLRSTW